MGQRAPGPSGSFRFLAEFAIEESQKSFILAILSSIAAGLLCSFYLAPTSGCKEKGHYRHGIGCAYGCYLSAFSRFVSNCCLQQLTNRSGQGRGDCSFQSQTPLAAAPYGLACSTFVSVDKMSERRQVLPLELLWCDRLCTPQGAVGANKYIYQYWDT